MQREKRKQRENQKKGKGQKAKKPKTRMLKNATKRRTKKKNIPEAG
jgi:hypothetical protein